MRDSVPSASYSSVCNVLRQWSIVLILTYRVGRLYDIYEKKANWRYSVCMKEIINTCQSCRMFFMLNRFIYPFQFF